MVLAEDNPASRPFQVPLVLGTVNTMPIRSRTLDFLQALLCQTGAGRATRAGITLQRCSVRAGAAPPGP